MALVKIGPFNKGAENLSPSFAMPKDQYGRQVCARRIVNADIGPQGHARLRSGYTLIQSFSGAHSLYSDGAKTFLVRAGVLYRVTSFSPYTEDLVKVLTSNAEMSYCDANGEIYCSNGADFGRISKTNAWSSHALPVPAAFSIAQTTGSLPAGLYQFAITYANGSSEEGGAKNGQIETTSTGAFVLTLPTASVGASHINVYVTDLNGGVPRFYTQVAVGTASVTINAQGTGRALQTAYLEPLPAGTVSFFNGRLLSFSGSRLYFSEPYNLGLYNPVSGFIDFGADISIVAPNQNGVYVASDVTTWIPGTNLAEVGVISDVLPYGAALGTLFTVPNTPLVGWYGARGVVIADANGQAKAVQEGLFAPDLAEIGKAIVIEHDGISRVVATLSGTTKSKLAVA